MAEDATLSYEELRRQINGAGKLLLELGVRREQRVLLILDDTSVFLGAIRIGAVPIPVSHLDKDENFRHFVEDSYAELVVIDAPLLQRVRETLGDRSVQSLSKGADGPGVTELAAAPAAQSDELDPVPTHRDDMAFWLYSSGSTGKPKGVVHLQHDVQVTCENYAQGVLGLRPDDVTFSTTKLFHAYGLGNGLSFPLSVGATAVYMTGPTKPAPILEMLRRHRPSVDMEHVLLEHRRVAGGLRGRGHRGDVSRVAAYVECLGDAGDDELADELRTWCKERLRRYEHPHIVTFVDDLPRTLTGKVQRFRLREWAHTETANPSAPIAVSEVRATTL